MPFLDLTKPFTMKGSFCVRFALNPDKVKLACVCAKCYL